MFVLVLFTLLLPGETTNAQIELSAGGGVHKTEPAVMAGVDFDARSDEIAFGLSIPFIATISDGRPHFDSRLWDSPTDYAHAIRYLTWRGRARFLDLGLRIGESHRINLGYGAIVRDLNPLLFMDTPHTGAQFGLSHENLGIFAFVDDFVDPQRGGFYIKGSHSSGIFMSFTLFADPKMPLSMRDGTGNLAVDDTLGILTPSATEQFLPLTVMLGYAPTTWLEAALEGITLNYDTSSAYGVTGHLRGRLKKEWVRATATLSAGGGGKSFLPFMVGPFYLKQREFSTTSTSPTLLDSLTHSDNNGFGMAATVHLTFKLGEERSLSITGDYRRNRLGDGISMEGSLVIAKRLILAFYGAMDTNDNVIFSTEARVALPAGWFLWARAKRLFAISPGNDYYGSSTQVLAGAGYREQTEP